MFRKCVVKCKVFIFIFNKMRLSVTISLYPRRQVASVAKCLASDRIMWVLSSLHYQQLMCIYCFFYVGDLENVDFVLCIMII